jgi:hypothetical protein
MVIDLELASHRQTEDETPVHVNPILWQQSLGLARHIAARVFRDGGRAADALIAVGLPAPDNVTWDKAVELIATDLSQSRAMPRRRAAA